MTLTGESQPAPGLPQNLDPHILKLRRRLAKLVGTESREFEYRVASFSVSILNLQIVFLSGHVRTQAKISYLQFGQRSLSATAHIYHFHHAVCFGHVSHLDIWRYRMRLSSGNVEISNEDYIGIHTSASRSEFLLGPGRKSHSLFARSKSKCIKLSLSKLITSSLSGNRSSIMGPVLPPVSLYS